MNLQPIEILDFILEDVTQTAFVLQYRARDRTGAGTLRAAQTGETLPIEYASGDPSPMPEASM